MNNDWPGDDDALNLALNDEALEKLLNTPSQQQQQQPQQEQQRIKECDGFDESVGNSWLFPSNLPLRSYQHSIVQAALYRNTLVVLPTGLGKTFIAAVVMYNLHRWYPGSKLIFMAPTRPLVSQQIAACQKIMPFPIEDAVELTGRLPRAKRAELWMSKRVFFATPQVVQSDMMDQGNGFQFPYNAIKLLVVDEAHRAKGRYAYTQVTESIMARNQNFRMLALSATPGRTMDDVAAVCRNLYISHVEVRWDDSIDVRQYVHQRSLRTIVVPLKDRIKEPRARLLDIIDPYLRQLIAANVLKGARGNISRNNLLYDQGRYQEFAAQQRHPEHSMIVSNFAMCISLYHSLELLERHGLRVFVNNFDADDKGRDKFVLRDAALRDLVEEVRQQLGANPLDFSTHTMTNGQVAPMPSTLDFGHPKYEQARQVLLQHFESNSESRAIVFCEYRESVMLIQRLLLQHRPLVRPRCFVGQSSNGGGICALTQKEQLQIMSDFRQGICNVLVATSIGEEGLDVGEVELIVCFDICSSNPTRFVQRIGRTGRQKKGAVVMLVTEGREQQLLKEVLASKDKTNRKLLTSTLIKGSLYPHAPRLVPSHLHPRCEQRFMEPIVAKPKTPSPNAKGGRKQSKVPAVKCQDLRKYFKQSQDRFLQDEPVYKQSEVSQRMLQQQVAQTSVAIKSFLLDTQESTPIVEAPAPDLILPSGSQEGTQRLKKMQRLLQATKPLISDSQRSQDLVAQLQDKQLPAALKLYILESNSQFVRETHSKMQQQLQQQLPEARLNSRQQRTRRIYDLLQDVCNGNLERLLQPKPASEELTLKDVLQPKDDKRFEATCDDIFRGLPERGLCSDNYELLQQQLEQLDQRQLEQTMKEQLGNESTGVYEQWEDQTETQLEESSKEHVSVYQSQWQEFNPKENPLQHSSTPLQVKQLPMQDDSRIESSQLSANLSRLNCIISAASTPLNKKLKKDSLLAELDEDMSAFVELTEQQVVPKEELTAVPTHEALDLDLNDFLDPLPEEQLLQPSHEKSEPPSTPRNLSPNLFSDDSISPWKPKRTAPTPAKTLAAKLAAKTTATIPPAKSPERPAGSKPVVQERSPSIFENYLRNMRGRGHLSKEAQRLHSMTSSITQAQQAHVAETGSGAGQEEDSPIVRCRRPAKRKIYDISDGEEEEEEKQEQEVLCTQLLPDDSYEEIPATQLPEQKTLQRITRCKRRKFNNFILEEADQSGSDHDEDEEAENTIGTYLKDSVVVSSDDENVPMNDTNAHAMYLQAMRSPMRRPGAFKIPAPRVFNDIYSQDVEPEPSQYYPSSFVVNDDSSSIMEVSHNVSECPLERAERILKEQRRQRKRGMQITTAAVQQETKPSNKRRRIHTLSDSSDDDVVLLDG